MPTAKEDWKMMATDAPNFTSTVLAVRAERFDRQIRHRNLREYAASAFVLAFFGWRMLTAASLIDQLASGLIILAALWAVIHIRRAGTPVEPDPTAPVEMQRHRWKAELERQQRLLQTVRWNYVAPFVPGFALFAAAPLIREPFATGAWIASGATVVLLATTLWFIDWLNRKAAAELGRTIAALD